MLLISLILFCSLLGIQSLREVVLELCLPCGPTVPRIFFFLIFFFLRIMFSLWLAKPIAATIFGDFSDSCCHHLQKDDPAGSEAEMCREKENLYIMNERLQEVTESLLTECVYTTETQLEGSYNCLTRTVMSLSEE